MTRSGPTPKRPCRAVRAGRGLLAAVVGVLLVLAGIVVGAVPAAAQNAVGAPNLTVANTVGVSADIGAGQRLGKTVPQPQIVVATGVAADTAAAEEGGVTVFRAARAGNGEGEVANGINAENHATDALGNSPGSAFVGSEDVAAKFAGQGGYESYYTAFRMKPEFASEFRQWPYEGGPGFEYEIPHGQIGRFNELTVSRTPVRP